VHPVYVSKCSDANLLRMPLMMRVSVMMQSCIFASRGAPIVCMLEACPVTPKAAKALHSACNIYLHRPKVVLTVSLLTRVWLVPGHFLTSIRSGAIVCHAYHEL
jgi:hypothetical protein